MEESKKEPTNNNELKLGSFRNTKVCAGGLNRLKKVGMHTKTPVECLIGARQTILGNARDGQHTVVASKVGSIKEYQQLKEFYLLPGRAGVGLLSL